MLRGTWNLPRPAIEPVSLAFQGGFLTTGPPGKPRHLRFYSLFQAQMLEVHAWNRYLSESPRMQDSSCFLQPNLYPVIFILRVAGLPRGTYMPGGKRGKSKHDALPFISKTKTSQENPAASFQLLSYCLELDHVATQR